MVMFTIYLKESKTDRNIKMKIISKQLLFNTAKTATAAILSILFASLLKLDFAISAGIVTILTIQPTKKETIKTALGRLYAFMVAMAIAYVSFHMIGFHVEAYFLYLVVFIFVCQIGKWHSAIAMNSVLISHFITFGNMELHAICNEVVIFGLGVGIGIGANLHLRKKVHYIEELKLGTDEQIIRILSRMSERILSQDKSDYNGECFASLKTQIQRAKNVAEENFNNQFGSGDIYDMEYIKMREEQIQVLYEMYKNVRAIHTIPATAEKISVFLREMSEVYHRNNTGKDLMEQFLELDASMKSQPLPVERNEFEDRAKLFGLLRSIEEFIQIKKDFAKKYPA